MTITPAILILAAGSSSRMQGADKLMEMVDGEPLIRRQARMAFETGCPVIVALPPDRPERVAAIAPLAVILATVPDAPHGMSASIRRGLAVARGLSPLPAGLMILPADMPDFTLPALQLIIAAFRENPTRILRATTAAGRPGHPAIFPPDLWDALDHVTGDQGGRQVLADHADRVTHIPLPGNMAITDLDTPEDWTRWRSDRL